MGVHLTFVRSVDLDEWTQRQIDAMRIGGNGNARAFFRKHGVSDMHSKTDKKYNSKAAKAYRIELKKLVDAEARKRGELIEGEDAGAIAGGAAGVGGSLLDNLDDAMKKEQADEAKRAIEAARSGGAHAGVLRPAAKLASSHVGAARLDVTPPNSGGLKLNGAGGGSTAGAAGGGSKILLRKPSSSAGSKLIIKKKPSNVSSKLRVSKLSTDATGGDGDDGLEDIDATERRVAEEERMEKEEAEKKARKDEELARQLQTNLDMGGASDGVISPSTASANRAAATAPVPDGNKPKPPEKKMSSHEENVAKLKNMTGDFFSGI